MHLITMLMQQDDESCLNAINLEYDTVPTNNSINYIIVDNSISLL